MGVKQTVRRQYQAIVDTAHGNDIERPAEGWIRTVRRALGMSGAQLAKKMGVTRSRIAQAEKAELDGGVTLKSMEAIAEAMGCRFVYAFVPPQTIENVIIAQARKKAQAIVGRAAKHMALEDQTVSHSLTQQEVARLMNELMYQMPSDFWEDK
ncbi:MULTISPECIES: mobile mystery protein A [unclassified Neorhizobium]|uniref:mobile mystery protein A n=1 Tax=unclassified Neorhizobium TaxID=2629175 RepID=UPI001FF37C58|nr:MULTISPECIES: mobile mystery protein A [unclassified Neorhizobium]MCJ9672469.1 mobile mystery protein A [Neorhizobium sp. SHOUNA12B]MCJ9745079.1 mobile mystery protein A [Neorhizobium sp. SHOUNA12A]